MKKVLIIAEAGVNHNGELNNAMEMIEAASHAGADIVKFQTFNAKKLATEFAKKADYQKKNTESSDHQLSMLKKLELKKSDYKILIGHCKKYNIQFLSTAFDLDSLRFLNSLNMPLFKIPSGEITNYPYLRKIAGYHKPVIMSTGMSTIGEIDDAINVLLSAGMQRKSIIALHCNTEYPTPFRDVNLSAMINMKNIFGVEVGYSDHTQGIEIPIAAVALGAAVIEKHFTLDNKMEGPDHKASLEPDELKAMIRAIRNIESAIGDGIKRPSISEFKNKEIARKSIVAHKAIKKNEIFTEKNITTKRPGNGISPMQWMVVLGKKAKRNFREDELIEL